MSYCSLSDVSPLVPTIGVLTASTVPTAAQGEALIATCAAEIDGVLSATDYELPVTGTEALSYLATVNAYGAAAFILKARYPTSAGTGGDSGASTFWAERYAACLESIRAGALGGEAEQESGRVSHGFRDSAGAALSASALVVGISRETRF